MQQTERTLSWDLLSRTVLSIPGVSSVSFDPEKKVVKICPQYPYCDSETDRIKAEVNSLLEKCPAATKRLDFTVMYSKTSIGGQS